MNIKARSINAAISLLGIPFVEYNRTRDDHTQTAMVCAKVLKEIAADNAAGRSCGQESS